MRTWITKKNKVFQIWMCNIPKPILSHYIELGTLRIQRESTGKSSSTRIVSGERENTSLTSDELESQNLKPGKESKPIKEKTTKINKKEK